MVEKTEEVTVKRKGHVVCEIQKLFTPALFSDDNTAGNGSRNVTN